MTTSLAVPRFATPRNLDRRTLGPEVGEVMTALGEPPMPWQRDCLAVAYELDEEATEEASSAAGIFQPRLWYRECGLTVPRQSGKTTKAKARHIHRQLKSKAYGWAPRPLSFYMAQTATDARDKMVEEWFPALEESPYYECDEDGRVLPASVVQQFIKSNGREAIKFLGGGRITVKPPSRTGGHGGSPDAVDLDEAFAHRDATAEQGVRPGMITKTSPQLWVVSTAGTDESEYLWGKVDAGRARVESGDDGDVCYFEYSAPEECDPADESVWLTCSPAVGFTIRLRDLRSEFDGMKLNEFKRAYLNIWCSAVARLIPAMEWNKCVDLESMPSGLLYLAADSSPAGAGTARTSSIAVAAMRPDKRVHVEIVKTGEGSTWLAETLREVALKHRAVQSITVDATGPIRSVVNDIREHSPVPVHVLNTQEMGAACGRFYEAVLDGTVAHRRQPALDEAVDGAAKRDLGDVWAFARRRSSSEISPLVAATEAYWQALNNAGGLVGIL